MTELDKLFLSQKAFVAFIADETLQLGTDDKKNSFKVPKRIPPLKLVRNDYFENCNDPKRCDLPEWFESRCQYEFSETDIMALNEWENQHKKKLFPRIIGPLSAFHKTEYFLTYMKNAESPSIKTGGAEGLYGQLLWIAKDKYLLGEDTTITEDEYRDFNIDFVVVPRLS